MGKAGDTAKGAAGGAATGAAIGGPWGAAIGGVAGGLLGYFGSGDDDEVKPELYDPENPYAQNARRFGRQPQGINHQYDIEGAHAWGTSVDQGKYSLVRGQQQGVVDQLGQQAQGLGPSAAGMSAAAQRDANLAQAAALQSGRRGQSAGAGIRAAGNQVAAGNMLAAQNESIGRAREMADARQAQSGLLGNMASNDIGVATTNAQLGQQANQFNASNQQAANIANQGRQYGVDEAEMMARQHQEDMRFTNLNPGRKGTDTGQELLNAGTTLAAAYLQNRNGGGGSVQKYARGGFVDRPTYALIGEAGPEMIVPLGPGHERMREKARGILMGYEPIDSSGLREDRSGVPEFANGGIVDPRDRTLSIGTRLAPDFNTAPMSRKALLSKGLGILTNTVLAKSMEDNAKRTAERKLYGGHTLEEVQADPTLRQRYLPVQGGIPYGEAVPDMQSPSIDRSVRDYFSAFGRGR